MLRSQTAPRLQQNLPFSFEFNWGPLAEMNGKDGNRRPPPAGYTAEGPRYGGLTPRTYSRPVSAAQPVESGTAEMAIFQEQMNLFPASYYHPTTSAPIEGHYMSTPNSSLIYNHSSSGHHNLSPQVPFEAKQVPFETKNHTAPDLRRHEQAYYSPYDGFGQPQDIDRESKRVRHSPCSEYDSSSSEYDPRERVSTASLPEYARSPQFPNSGKDTTRSSPVIGGFSPLDIGSSVEHDGGPRSTPGYSHLVAQFPQQGKKERKKRRKLRPLEREQVHQLRKMGACTRCWGLKMKCDDGSPCHRCQKLGAGALCVRVHFVDLDVFSKWLVDGYSRTMMHHVLQWASGPERTINVSHKKSLGVSLQLSVFEFVPAFPDQLSYWYKDASGWQSTPTTPFAMKRGINTDVLEKYIHDHTLHYTETAFDSNAVLSEIFTAAWRYSRSEENFLLRDALQLWTATQMLIDGASLHPSSDALGILPITSPTAAQVNQTPLPRVLANQLDHLLERRIWQLEKQILCELQKRIFGRKREDWLKIFFTLVVFMNTLERDSWRLFYWLLHIEDGYAWRHPSTPKALIEKNETLAGSLAAHFVAISKGLNPFALDWSREQSIPLIGSCEDREAILGALERIGLGLRNPEQTPQFSSIEYREADQQSLDFLYSSKVMVLP